MGIRSRWLFGLLILVPSLNIGQAKEPKQNKHTEISTEVILIEIRQDEFESLKRRGLLGDPVKSTDAKNIILLNNAQKFRFLREIVAGDRFTDLKTMPRLTVHHGQTARLDESEPVTIVSDGKSIHRKGQVEYQPKSEVVPLGVQIALRPIVSADRRSVQLHVDAKMNDFVSMQLFLCPSDEAPFRKMQIRLCKEGSPDPKPIPGVWTQYIHGGMNRLRLNRTVAIPDGDTAVLTDLTKEHEDCQVTETPVLSKLPYIGELFDKKTTHHETHKLLVLLTTQIRVPRRQ